MADLTGARALVTGAAGGIGAAVTAVLREQGARVAALDRTAAPGDGADVVLACDLTDRAAVPAAVAQAADALGGLDILVNNAGIGAVGGIEDNDDDEWHRVLDVNVLGLVRVTRAALPYLRSSRRPAIVNTGSVVAVVGVPQRAAYSATKGAVHALTLAMAADLLADGIRVNAVAPATTDTAWVGRLLADTPDPAAARAALEARQPLGRLIDAGEVAAAIAYLAGPAAGATTGTVLLVDGGMSGLRLPR